MTIKALDAALAKIPRHSAQDWGEGVSYRSSGHHLSKAGEDAKQAGVTKKALRDWCEGQGLDKEQTSHVMGGYADDSALDAALARIPRHRGVTLRTGLDRTLARGGARDAGIPGHEQLRREYGNALELGRSFKKQGKTKEQAEQFLSGEKEDFKKEFMKGFTGDKLTAALALIPDHAPLGDRLRRRLGLTGLDATLALIPDRRVRDESREDRDKKIRELTVKANRTDNRQEKQELARQIEELKRQDDSESDLVACYKKHLAGGSSRSEAIAETAAEHGVPERDVSELVLATGDAPARRNYLGQLRDLRAERYLATVNEHRVKAGKTPYTSSTWSGMTPTERSEEYSDATNDSALDRALRAIPDRRRARDAGFSESKHPRGKGGQFGSGGGGKEKSGESKMSKKEAAKWSTHGENWASHEYNLRDVKHELSLMKATPEQAAMAIAAFKDELEEQKPPHN